MTFKDHFSGHAAQYAAFRPRYPDSLPAALAALAPGRDLAWDVGCGNGQLSVGLAAQFRQVVATDASAEQVAGAEPHPRVQYEASPAEHSPLADGCADLVVAAQAAHWFDLPRFYDEARRVAKPGAVMALVSYGVLTVTPELDGPLMRLYRDVLGAYWPPERRLVDEGYRSLEFPFPERAPPDLWLEQDWTLPQLAGYLRTWSAVKRAEAATGADPVAPVVNELAGRWGDSRRVRWPLNLRLGLIR